MTPSRAVLIFKSRAQATAATSTSREALPWWIFAAAGGVAHRLAGPRTACAGSASLAAATGHPIFGRRPGRLFLPGRSGGRRGRLVRHPAGQRGAGLGVPRFNRGFDGMTEHLRLDRRPGAAAERGWSCSSTAACSALTWWTFVKAPTGFIPQQDQGRLIVNVQLPDSASLERTKEVVAQVDKICHETRRACGTRSPSPACRSCSRPTVPTSRRCSSSSTRSTSGRSPSLRDTAIMAKLRQAWAEQVKDAHGHRVRRRRRFPASARPAASSSSSRIAATSGWSTLQKQTDDVVRKLQQSRRA